MCIIALDNRTASKERIPQDVLLRCWETYPDGLGLMYAKNDRLHTWKSLDDFDGLWNRYTSARDDKLRIALHFRKTTQGGTDVENCHPFNIVEGEFAFMHNGTFRDLTSELPDGVSDTKYLRDELLSVWPPDFLNRPAFYTMLKSFAGRNRLLFMDRKGRYTIFNKSVGFWWPGANDVWFSHCRDRSYLITGNKSSSAGYGRATGITRWCQKCRTQTDHGTVDHDNDKHGEPREVRRYCHECAEVSDHFTQDCPSRQKDEVDSEDPFADIDREFDKCPWCETSHSDTPCPFFMDRHGKCVFCGAYEAHIHMGHCPEFDLACEVCDEYVQYDEEPSVTDGYFHHATCEVRECARCKRLIHDGESSLVLGIQGGKAIHSSCSTKSTANAPPDRADGDDSFDEYIERSRRTRDFWRGNDSEMAELTLPTGDVIMVNAVTGSNPVSDRGVYLFGKPTCTDCIIKDDLVDGWNPHNAWEIPVTDQVEITCVGCGAAMEGGS